MLKTIYSREYELLLSQLRAARVAAGLTQSDVAERLKTDQPWVSRVESGERRLDVVELRAYCSAIGFLLIPFLQEFEQALAAPKSEL